MYQSLHEELARAKRAEHRARAERVGIKRSARLISLEIRRQRRAGHER